MRGNSSASQRSRPRFWWQGALIILPALLLAALGLYSLRQDRVLARVEATEQAKRLVNEWTQELLPRVLEPGLSELEKWETDDLRAASGSIPRSDALMRLEQLAGGLKPTPGLFRTACLFDDAGALVYPPPLRDLATPQPLELENLTPAQLSAWFACEEMWLTGAPDTRRVGALVALGTPERLVAVARMKTALSLTRVQNTVAAGISELRALRDVSRSELSESGIPLRDLARLQLVALSGAVAEEERRAALEALCADLLQFPSPISEALWETLRTLGLGSEMERWMAAKATHAQGRELARQMESAPPLPGPVMFRGEECWIIERRQNVGRWLVAVPTAHLRATVEDLQQRTLKAPHFGVEIRWSNRPSSLPTPERTILAEAKTNLNGVPLEVAVVLSDPVAFDAQREVRAQRMIAVIAAAVLAVLAGFFAAWRAFRREQQLSEMKTNFVSSVSHELRAPIASVQLMAQELVEGERPSDEKLAKYHSFIGQECRRLSGVIENVLDFARREQGRERFEFEPTDLGALVSATVQLLRPYAAERGVNIAEERNGEMHPVEADGHALQRVLVNLLDNAIKHSPEGATVLVGLEFEPQRVLLWVEDDGPGIPRAEQERIFEKFYRIGSELRRQTQGVGLGLSIVKHLAEVHGGRVLVHSNVGEGSRFTVEIPLREMPPISQPSPESTKATP